MKLFFLSVLAVLPLCAQQDRYPEIRALLREAETAAAPLQLLADGGNPHTWLAGLYARAGYLDDAIRAYGKPTGPHYGIWQAQVVYGDLAGAEKSLLAIPDPESRAMSLTGLAHLLWSMGQPDEARSRYEAARKLLPAVVNPEHRKRMLASIELGVSALAGEPPNKLSATPTPRPRMAAQNSPFARFPITTDGFRGLPPTNIGFMNELFTRMEAQDRDGMLRVAAGATTPFQKLLGQASFEHIFIQIARPDLAEEYTSKMEAPDSDCSLAKAEALSAAGGAWLRAGNAAKAHPQFDAAIALVKSVRDLPYGKVLVILTIASDQARDGLVASSGSTFALAKELAQAVPLRPPPVKSPIRADGRTIHYRDDAYKQMLVTAIRAHDLGAANETARVWRSVDKKAGSDIVRAWLDAGRTEDAIASAREITGPSERVSALLVLARELLDLAGAPNI